MRYAAAVEYLGSNYSGWQRQHHAPSLQDCIEKALGQVANYPVETTCAGRTDAGVHALGQVIHFDSPNERESQEWLFGVNALLPPDISLCWVKAVSEDFHARYTATSRRYAYVIHDHRARSAILNGRVAWSRQPLNSSIMHEAGQHLLGEQDFSAFRAAECQSRTAMRCVTGLSVVRHGDLVVMEIEANAFLHHMVRNIAGVLIAVGSGQRSVNWPKEVLASRNRSEAGVTAPAQGLYFMQVKYPDEWDLPVNQMTSQTTGIFLYP